MCVGLYHTYAPGYLHAHLPMHTGLVAGMDKHSDIHALEAFSYVYLS